MASVADEISFIGKLIANGIDNAVAADILQHYGTPRHSGRYPWGSGENPYQHEGDFVSRVQEYRQQGLSDKEIAKLMNLQSSTQLRVEYSAAMHERKDAMRQEGRSLREKGYSYARIAEELGLPNESSARSLLNEHSEAKMSQAKNTAEFLKGQVSENNMIDVGVGTEKYLGVSSTKLNEALYLLQREGYEVYNRRVPQVTNPTQMTTIKVLCPPGTTYKDVYDNLDNIHAIRDFRSRDDGQTFKKTFVYPESMDSSRLSICYGDEGGKAKDGLVEIRRGVEDLSLGKSNYAQVRILVDGTHYIKGMAVYSDDLPDGVDVRFNTNKKSGTPLTSVLKPITNDPDNPFGSLIKEDGGQSTYFDKDGVEHLSLINKRAEEGDWNNWGDTLPAQFLSKQPKSLVKKQIDLSVSDKQAEFDEICAYTNPTVKRSLLNSFADDCDSTAVHLNAAALPRQRWQVIVPIPEMKDTEIYAPNFKDGEKVALIRYPHAGTFEIPIVTVNNKQPNAKKVLTNTPADAVGINAKVAERLSGADFDGDTVMVIPTHDRQGKVKITSTPQLTDLKDFDAKMEYPYHEGMKTMSKGYVQRAMGEITNLIADMTLIGAPDKEIAKAVKHSMVVIDAYKHKLDYRQSYIDNDIAYLKKKYQGVTEDDGSYHEGAATLVTRSKSETRVPQRQGQPKVNIKGKDYYDPSLPEGALIYTPSGRTRTVTDKDGSTHTETIMEVSTKMAETRDAHTLSNGHPIEELYADYANKMKALANDARKESYYTGTLKSNPAAKETYKEEVSHLNAQLNVALMNAPREREAQRLANVALQSKVEDNPSLALKENKKDYKKAAQQELTRARNIVGAKRHPIEISDKEWEAIQAGAISDNKLTQILRFANPDRVKQLAMPRSTTTVSPAKQAKIKNMSNSNYTPAEIAEACGVSVSTVYKYIK